MQKVIQVKMYEGMAKCVEVYRREQFPSFPIIHSMYVDQWSSLQVVHVCVSNAALTAAHVHVEAILLHIRLCL